MDDLIKRSDVWNITAILHSEFITIEQEQILERIDEMVDGLPSADRPQGKWIKNNLGIVICSECKRPRRDNRVNHINFCNSCGARMRPKLQGKHFDSIIIDESAMKGADDGKDIQSEAE